VWPIAAALVWPAGSIVIATILSAGCSRSDGARPSPAAEITIRVPAALRLARSLDTLTVAFDPAARAPLVVVVRPGALVGIETTTFVYPVASTRPSARRRAVAVGEDLDRAAPAWDTQTDGLPLPGIRYVVEMEVTFFETDVPPRQGWDPHAGRYKALWSRTLRQAEE
jgi:hypothetical protein